MRGARPPPWVHAHLPGGHGDRPRHPGRRLARMSACCSTSGSRTAGAVSPVAAAARVISSARGGYRRHRHRASVISPWIVSCTRTCSHTRAVCGGNGRWAWCRSAGCTCSASRPGLSVWRAFGQATWCSAGTRDDCGRFGAETALMNWSEEARRRCQLLEVIDHR